MNIPNSEHGEKMLCTEIDFDIQNNLCTQHVLSMFCKRRASDKDLLVQVCQVFRFKGQLKLFWWNEISFK